MQGKPGVGSLSSLGFRWVVLSCFLLLCVQVYVFWSVCGGWMDTLCTHQGCARKTVDDTESNDLGRNDTFAPMPSEHLKKHEQQTVC